MILQQLFYMFPGYYYGLDITYFILVILALILALVTQVKVKSAYFKYSKVPSQCGMTGREAAERVLALNGVTNVQIQMVSGPFSDHYDPRSNVIRLSEGVYNSSSVAALGIAAHEAGHACQYKDQYFPIKIRNAILPIASIGSNLAVPLVLIGLLFNFYILIQIGIIFYVAAKLFQLVTLPVEFNASGRAMKTLESGGLLNDSELKQTRKVLSAAAMTYVASLAVALMSLLRLILIANGGRRRQ